MRGEREAASLLGLVCLVSEHDFIGANIRLIKSPLGFPFFDWLSQNQGVVAVSVAYRLNLLGFLGGAAVAADGDLNTGLRDWRARVNSKEHPSVGLFHFYSYLITF